MPAANDLRIELCASRDVADRNAEMRNALYRDHPDLPWQFGLLGSRNTKMEPAVPMTGTEMRTEQQSPPVILGRPSGPGPEPMNTDCGTESRNSTQLANGRVHWFRARSFAASWNDLPPAT